MLRMWDRWLWQLRAASSWLNGTSVSLSLDLCCCLQVRVVAFHGKQATDGSASPTHAGGRANAHTFPLFTNYIHTILNTFLSNSMILLHGCQDWGSLSASFCRNDLCSGIKCHFTSDEARMRVWMMWRHGGFTSACSTVACQWNANRRWQSHQWCSFLSLSLPCSITYLCDKVTKKHSPSLAMPRGTSSRTFARRFKALVWLQTDRYLAPFPLLAQGMMRCLELWHWLGPGGGAWVLLMRNGHPINSAGLLCCGSDKSQWRGGRGGGGGGIKWHKCPHNCPLLILIVEINLVLFEGMRLPEQCLWK